MIQKICKDIIFLQQSSEKAVRADEQVGRDLLDTLQAHKDECVGMAANMIGVNKAIIAVNIGMANILMYNPVIVKKESPFETEEGCLSLDGVRKTKRYRKITVEFENIMWKKTRQQFTGFTAQIIQHECDHLEGKLI